MASNTNVSEMLEKTNQNSNEGPNFTPPRARKIWSRFIILGIMKREVCQRLTFKENISIPKPYGSDTVYT